MPESRPMKIKLKMEKDGGPATFAYTVTADQRDWAAMEGADIEFSATPVTGTRFIGFNAAVRAKRYSGTWEEFNAKDCVSADQATGKAAEGEEGLDPGRTDQSGDA